MNSTKATFALREMYACLTGYKQLLLPEATHLLIFSKTLQNLASLATSKLAYFGFGKLR